MARIRSTKPEFWEDECLGKMSLLARLTFLALKDQADDHGRGLGDPDGIWAMAHRYQPAGVKAHFRKALAELGVLIEQTPSDSRAHVERTSSASEAHVERTLSARQAHVERTSSSRGACKTCGKPHVVFYKVDGCTYYWLPRFNKHQKIDRPSKSKLPPPPLSTNPRDNSSLEQGSGIKDQGSRREEEEAPCAVPPPAEEKTKPKTQKAPEVIVDAEVDKTVKAFDFCGSPGELAKAIAVKDLLRIGLSHEYIRAIAAKRETKPFYLIIRSLEKGEAVPDFKPSESVKENCRTCHDRKQVVDHKNTIADKTAWKPCPDCPKLALIS